MRFVVVCVIFIVAYLVSGCSDLSGPGMGIDDPPLPSTASICPLTIGSYWEYWGTWYDANGIKIQLNERTLSRKIPGGYLLNNDTMLVSVNDNNYYTLKNNGTSQYVYKFEWEELDSGLLVKHVGNGDLNKRGLYIAGEYARNNNIIYSNAVLWLAYPSTKGTMYSVAIPGHDSTEIFTMQVLETAAGFYAPIENRYSASPLYFRDSCYLYKESIKTAETFYYYHPKIGCLGYLKYVNGKLVSTHILKYFDKGNGYYN